MLVVGSVVTLQEWLLRTARAVGISMNLEGKIFVTNLVLYCFTGVRLHSSQKVLGGGWTWHVVRMREVEVEVNHVNPLRCSL